MWNRRALWSTGAVLALMCAMAGGDALDPSETSTDDRQHWEKVFSRESGATSFNHLMNLHEAHERLYDAVIGQSNLGKYDTGTNENPFIFVGGEASKLPADATITLTLTKEEFVALKMPTWESIALGGPNHGAFLKAWMAYQSYENARLRLELLKLKSPEGPDAQRAELKSEMAALEKEIVAYLESEPAD